MSQKRQQRNERSAAESPAGAGRVNPYRLGGSESGWWLGIEENGIMHGEGMTAARQSCECGSSVRS